MALDKRVHIYSVDTGAFYYPSESKLHWKLIKLRRRKEAMKHYVEGMREKYKGEWSVDQQEERDKLGREIKDFVMQQRRLNRKIKRTKQRLLDMFAKRAENSEMRSLNAEQLVDKNVIALFESSLTRMLNEPVNSPTPSTDIIVVRVFYFDVLRDLITNGFTLHGEKYKYFTSSAGQIRTKKCVFIKQSLWDEHEKTLMCGLTLDDINAKGGINVNKLLAYLALSNSATEEWTDFDIDKTIVVPDFETNVLGAVDFIDDVTYEITRKEMYVPIKHTDGCGLMLPSVSEKNFMVRLPWVKGLLATFDFKKFIAEVPGASPVITDVYGVERDVIKEDIQIIFTASQFKLYKYYSSWEEYKTFFKQYGCSANTCNEEEDKIPDAQINYQMLQTLTDLTDEEIRKISNKSRAKLNRLKSEDGAREALRLNCDESRLNGYKKCLLTYPALFRTTYTKQTLRNIKNSLTKQYRGGRLEVDGKFTFVLPDLYAVCENWFCNIPTPKGLLQGDDVSCRLFSKTAQVACLRSPHLYREWSINKNIVNERTKPWFTTKAVYTSTYSLMSKLLQFDKP